MGKKKTRKRSNKKNLIQEERFRKIFGAISLFMALYLCVAFVSYFYTWKPDQDKVLQFSWEIIFQGGLQVDNWLGRFGAFISNMFFYWGFGIPSMAVIILLIKLGVDLLRKKSLLGFFQLSKIVFGIVLFSSVLFEYIFRSSNFSWGGAFGESACFWLSNFLGNVGLGLLFAFVIIGFLIWYFNPSFEQLELSIPGGKNWRIPHLKFKKENLQNETTEQDQSYKPLKPTFSENFHEATPKSEFSIAEKVSGIAKALELDVIKDKFSKQASVLSKAVQGQLELDSKGGAATTDAPSLEIQAEKDSEEPLIPQIQEEEQDPSQPYDPTLELSSYEYPSVELLRDYEDQKVEVDRAELENNKDQIIETLLNYKIEIVKIRATIGPTVTLYEIVPAPGVKISKIKNLEDDIALSLSALGIRIIAPIPGKGTIGIEVPNKKKQIVSLKEVIRSEKFQNAKMALPIALGKTISNEVFVADLAKMPHLLIAGATGQGKSVGINAILMSLLYKKHPSQVKLVLIDPKKVELFPYCNIDRHFLAFLPNEEEPIVTETNKVIYTLNSMCLEMEDRYNLLKKARARNIKEYNQKFTARELNPLNGHRFMPFIILVIDEFADLIMTAGKEIELPIARLAQLARAVGIHLIIATQRPSVNIITGVIKANFPARIAFKVTSKIDSRTILDQGGADQLIGRGDMLLSIGGNMVRLQCAFVDTPEIEDVIHHIDQQHGYPQPFFLPEYQSEDDEIGLEGSRMKFSDLDENFEDAAKLVVANQHGSTSMLQRKLQLGYNRAGRIMDQLEALSIVGPAQGSKPRDVYIFNEQELIQHLNQIRNRD
jgi:S-DNA-T family DNA segregation ATPase FtsK/SpoIIIE